MQTGLIGAGGGSRTLTPFAQRQILSLVRLPVPPLQRSSAMNYFTTGCSLHAIPSMNAQPFRNLHEGMRLRAAGEGFRQVAWWGAVAPVYFAAGFFLGAPT